MEQFAVVAIAHIVALLIPGVDFFLIVRATTAGGWKNASGACVGIALANGVFITGAFSGLAVLTHPVLLGAIQLAGGAFLVVMGVTFFRSKTPLDLDAGPAVESATWLKNLGLGCASGLLNPKNALFYVSLAAAVSTASPAELTTYGLWLFTVVLVWDLCVALAFGSRPALERMGRLLPLLTKNAGAVLVLFGCGMLATVLAQVAS